MDWRLKALAFRVLDLPGGSHAHYFLQRRLTRNWPRPSSTLNALAGIAQRVTADYARHVSGMPASVLEIGAGRDLAVPLALRHLGVKRVVASDVTRLARLDLIQHAADQLLGGQVRFDNWDDLERFGISYRAPNRVMVTDGKVDCSCSNEVLEHVPPDQLVDLLAGLRPSRPASPRIRSTTATTTPDRTGRSHASTSCAIPTPSGASSIRQCSTSIGFGTAITCVFSGRLASRSSSSRPFPAKRHRTLLLTASANILRTTYSP